jgi:hypothetical protein
LILPKTKKKIFPEDPATSRPFLARSNTAHAILRAVMFLSLKWGRGVVLTGKMDTILFSVVLGSGRGSMYVEDEKVCFVVKSLKYQKIKIIS